MPSYNEQRGGAGAAAEINQQGPASTLQGREVGQQVQAGTGIADGVSARPDLTGRAEVTTMGGPGTAPIESVPIGLPVAEENAGDPAAALQGREVGVQVQAGTGLADTTGERNDLSSRAPVATPTVGGGAQVEDSPTGLPVAEVEQDNPPVVLLGREIGVQVI